MANSSSLSEYLKKYTSEGKPKSSKKKKLKSSVNRGGVRIVDEDAVWQAEIKDDSEHEDSPDERPQVTEDIEVKRMKRMEELKMHRPYLTVADDGSGWRTVSQPDKPDLKSDDFVLKEQGSTDPPDNRELSSAHLNSRLYSPNKNLVSAEQRDVNHTEKRSNYERDDFSSELNVNDSGFLSQKKVHHDSPDISSPPKSWTEAEGISHSVEHQRDFGSLHPLPQKKVRHDSPDQSPRQKFSTKSPDLSPPRRHMKDVNSDSLAKMKFQIDSSDQSYRQKLSTISLDSSPPRRHQKYINSDRLAEMKFQNDSPDQSPRQNLSTKSPDLSPPRRHQKDVGFSGPVLQMKVRHDSPDYHTPKTLSKSPDLSPPRKRQKDLGYLDCPPQRNFRNDSPDQSPQRKVWTKPEDLSPPRRHQKDVGLSDSFPQSKTRHDSPDEKDSSFQDNSHARNAHVKDHDFSPPRRIHQNSSRRAGDSSTKGQTIPPSGPAQEILSERHMMKKTRRKEIMGDGTNVGLHTGKDLKKEIDQKKREDSQRFSKIDSSLTGRNAETIYRDKRGRRLEGVEELLKLQQGEPKPEATPLEWGKGLAQKKEAEAKQAELELEKNKPFARTRDDPELDNMLKERIRWGDPMAHLVKKKSTGHVLENYNEDEKMIESGFIIPQDIPNHSWLARGVDPPPNRYGIKPGRHWDGVDRSNGFEKGLFKRQNEKQATETEAYLWSVADM